MDMRSEWYSSFRLDGTRYLTPLAIALIAIGTADVIFAVDSIPAIFGLTQETFLVFAANAFSLLGLRQLFFLIDGPLDRLVYLSYGLAVILGFIGAELVVHALHTNRLPFINGGEHVTAIPEIPIWLLLAVILGTLVVTTVASLAKAKQDRLEHVAAEVERRLIEDPAADPAPAEHAPIDVEASGAIAARR